MNIRPERPEDIVGIRHVTHEAFDHHAGEVKLVDFLRECIEIDEAGRS